MTTNSNELHQLVIRNLSILEAAPKVVEEVEKKVFEAINLLIRNWYEEKNWEGIADYYGIGDETRISPSGWPKDEKGSYKAWYSFEATNADCNYYLSALTGIASSGSSSLREFGLWFIVDTKAITGQTNTGQANKLWKDYLAEQVRLHLELEQAGFKIFSENRCYLYLPVRIDAELLAQLYPDVDEALAPINQALKLVENAHPVIDKILKNALRKFKTGEIVNQILKH